jgi:hypothetical protein
LLHKPSDAVEKLSWAKRRNVSEPDLAELLIEEVPLLRPFLLPVLSVGSDTLLAV